MRSSAARTGSVRSGRHCATRSSARTRLFSAIRIARGTTTWATDRRVGPSLSHRGLGGRTRSATRGPARATNSVGEGRNVHAECGRLVAPEPRERPNFHGGRVGQPKAMSPDRARPRANARPIARISSAGTPIRPPTQRRTRNGNHRPSNPGIDSTVLAARRFAFSKALVKIRVVHLVQVRNMLCIQGNQ